MPREAARASNGNSGIPHTLAHLQVVHPDDQQRPASLASTHLHLCLDHAPACL